MNVLFIGWRELRATFHSTIGWLVLCGFLLLTGVFWVFMVQNYVIQSQDVVFNPYAAATLNLTDHLLAPFFGNCAVVLMMIAPALTMRLFAEEVRQRTLELLLTSPVSSFEIVLGKYLGAMGFVTVLLAATAHCPIGLMQWGSPELGAVGGGYLGLLMLASSLVSMGMLYSSLTANQIVASVLTFASSLALFVLDWGSRSPTDWNARLSLQTHLMGVLQGAPKASDIAFFVLFTVFFLFATWQRIESFRWR